MKALESKNKVRKLSDYCLLAFIKDPKILQNVANVPYRLLEDVFKQINIEPKHLNQLEKTNIFFIFEDGDLWLEYLKREFPTNVSESYISNKKPIVDYYINIFNESKDKLDKNEIDLFDRYVRSKLKKDVRKNKYKVPYRMLFENYHKDAERKKEQSAERLRKNVEKLNKEREMNQTVTVDYPMFMHAQLNGPRKRKQFWDDRNPIKSIDKHNNSHSKDIAARLPPSRVAFGGMAGRQIKTTHNLIKPPVSEMKLMKRNPINKNISLIRHDSSINSESDRGSSQTETDNSPKTSPRKPRLVSSSRRHQNHQNIFLNKNTIIKKKPIATAINNRKPHETTFLTGTNKKQSNIFQKAEPILANTIKIQNKTTAQPKHPSTPHASIYINDTRPTPTKSSVSTNPKSSKTKSVRSLKNYLINKNGNNQPSNVI